MKFFENFFLWNKIESNKKTQRETCSNSCSNARIGLRDVWFFYRM